MDNVLAQVVTGAITGSLYAMVAVAANLTFRAVRMVNFAQGPMMLVAALLSATLVRAGPLTGLPGPLAAILAMLVSLAVLVAVLVLTEALIARPALRAGGMLGWVFATFGIGIVLQGIASLVWGSGGLAFPDMIFTAQSSLPIFGLQIQLRAVALPALAIAVLIVTEVLRRWTLWGQALRAVSMSADLAALQGLPLPRIALLASVASATLAGLAGILMAQISGTIGPAFGLRMMMLGFVATLIGGLGTTTGAIIGGLVVGLADAVIGTVSQAPSAGHAALLALLILILVRRPQGLFGRVEIVRL